MENELYHYGVLGMRWGVRKDRQTKTRMKKDSVKTFQTEFVDTKVTVAGTDTHDAYRKQLDSLKLSERTNFYMPKGVASKRLQNLPLIENRSSEKSEQLKVNDPTSSKKRTTNCFQCTIAYEMRKRGYDVQANTNFGGHNFEYFHAFDILDSFTVKSKTISGGSSEKTAKECYDRVAEQCLAYGNGARGVVTMRFPLGGGHVMNWIVEDGEFKLVDAQNTGKDEYETFSNSTFDIEVVRLDNAKLLPGSTDFVEVYEPFEKIKKKTKEIVNKIGDNISKFISDGISFVEKFFKK